MYINKTISPTLATHFKEHNQQDCEKCRHPDTPAGSTADFDPAKLSLTIMSRCFTFQIEALILN